MRLRDRERDFGQRREEATIGGGGCDEPALPIWFRNLGLFQRETTARMRTSARMAAAGRRLRRLRKNTPNEKTTTDTKSTESTESKTTTESTESTTTESKTTTESTETETNTETETEMKEKGSTSTIMRMLYGQNYSENEPGHLDGLYEPLSKFTVLEGSAEVALKSVAKAYSVKDLDAADATKSLVKAASGYEQIEQSTMIKQCVGQGEVIIQKLDQALAGIERLETVLGTGGGGGRGSGGSSGGGGGCEGGGGSGGDGGSSGGEDFGASPVDFDNPFV